MYDEFSQIINDVTFQNERLDLMYKNYMKKTTGNSIDTLQKSMDNLMEGIQRNIDELNNFNMTKESKPIPKVKPYLDFDYTVCKLNSGEELDHTIYDKMIVSGESLDLFGINNDDVIFVRKQTPAQLTKNINNLPKTLVFKRIADATNQSEYMIARTWCIINRALNYNIKPAVRKIADKRGFITIKNDIRFVDYNYLFSVIDKKEIPNNVYQLAIITRLDQNGYWVVDYVPASDFYGVVEYTWHKDNFNLA